MSIEDERNAGEAINVPRCITSKNRLLGNVDRESLLVKQSAPQPKKTVPHLDLLGLSVSKLASTDT